MATAALARDDVDFLSLLSAANRRRVLERSTRAVYSAGTIAFRPGDPLRAYLVERGLLRIFMSIPDGRQATVAFIHASELAGGVTIMTRPPSVFAQVVVESILTTLEVETVRRVVARENQVSRAVATHLATQVRDAFRLIAVRSLGSIRERLAYDLLERACQCQLQSGQLESEATQADLAASIGSSREVVSRAIKGFRATGIIKTRPGVVRVIDAVRLAQTVRAIVAA